MPPSCRNALACLLSLSILPAFQTWGGASAGAQEFGERFSSGGRYIGSDPVLTPDGKAVVFGSPRRNTAGDICQVNLDGSGFKTISSEPFYEGQPDVSPCGSLLAFVSESGGRPLVYLMNMDGTQRRRLTRGEQTEFAPRFSPDGKKVAVCRHMARSPDAIWSREVFVIDIESGDEFRVTQNRTADYPVAFSEGADWIFCESTQMADQSPRSFLWRRSLRGENAEQAIPFGVNGVYAVCPASELFLFTDDRAQPFFYEIYSYSLNSERPRRLTHLSGYIGSIRAASIDGRDVVMFVLEPKRDGIGDIYMLDVKSSELTMIGKNIGGP